MLKTKFALCLLLLFLILPKSVIAEPHVGEQKVLRAEDTDVEMVSLPPTTPPETVETPQDSDSLKAGKKISVEALRSYLENNQSPLAPYSEQILQSDYWSTIIGICTIEQYSCSHAPSNNYWGLMKSSGGLQKFATPQDGIAAISAYMDKLPSRGKTTFKSLRGWYCVNRNYPGNVCPGWEQTVKRVKAQLEGQ